MTGFLDRLGRRWEGRRADADRVLPAGGRPAPPPPGGELTAEHVALVPCPPTDVWSLLSTPRLLTVDLAPGDRAFALPGRQERWCVVPAEGVGGAMLGSLVVVLEREEGRRIVTRGLSARGRPTYDWSVFPAPAGGDEQTLVRLTVTADVKDPGSRACQDTVHRLAEHGVGWVAHRLVGAPAPTALAHGLTQAQRAARERHAQRPLVEHDVTGQVVVPLPPAVVWAGLLDPATFSMGAADGERAVVVPGTPPGQVGELRALVAVAGALQAVVFHELVEIGPGMRLVLRHHSASHPAHLFVEVEPHELGSLVGTTMRVLRHPDSGLAQLDRVRAEMTEYLSRLRLDLLARSAG